MTNQPPPYIYRGTFVYKSDIAEWYGFSRTTLTKKLRNEPELEWLASCRKMVSPEDVNKIIEKLGAWGNV